MMAKRNIEKMMKASIEFDKEIKSMQQERLIKGTDIFPKVKSARRITLGITRHKLFPKIKEDIINSELKDDLII